MGRKSWEPSIYAAHAIDYNRFCLSLSDFDHDDPFSAILRYDGSFPQPWSRSDVKREINSIVSQACSPGGQYAALSSEGDVYMLNGKTTTEKIIGAGLLSPDASGSGIMLDMQCVGATLFASGWCGQLFVKKTGQPWQSIDTQMTPPRGFQKVNFTHIGAIKSDDIYLCGVYRPEIPDLDKDEVDRLVNNNASAEDWEQAYFYLDSTRPDLPTCDRGCLFHWTERNLVEVDVGEFSKCYFNSFFIDESDVVWLVGSGSAILHGNAKTGFVHTSLSGDQTFISITKFGDRFIIASEDNLYYFDGKKMEAMKRPPIGAPLRPKKVQAAGKVLFYFDYAAGVFRFDGSAWEQIQIPRALYARDFRR